MSDTDDNCINVANIDQKNTRGDPSLGDACDPTDTDGDGAKDFNDNYVADANTNQNNTPGGSDLLGDACEDRDNDGVVDGLDNCIGEANPGQQNVGSGLLGDACEDDDDGDDGDGVSDLDDNCPTVVNADQSDGDNDGIGAACDAPGAVMRLMLTGNSNVAINGGARPALDLANDMSTLAAALRGIAAGLPADMPRIEAVERVRYSNDAIELFREENRPCVSSSVSANSASNCPLQHF